MAGPLTGPHRNKPTRRILLLRVGLMLLLALLVIGSWSWWTFVSPHAYSPPSSSVIATDAGDQRVFAYGTLRNPLLRLLITREQTTTTPAHLPGYRKQGLDIIKADEEITTGVVFTVTPEGLRRLDRYERLGVRYERRLLNLTDGEAAWVYQRLEE
jgi:gamma-glutamylcyclotransferase (GGCT)/AIG2-like uncharacterized protein YtfP